jgi:NAD(P)-dependent dehydrogenase (short-subunit alcohol dehydrogenase family)
LTDSRRFQGKVVLITGAASGIGRATAVRLAGEGARLFLVDLAKEGLDETAKRCAAASAEVESAPCDVAQEEQVNDAVARCVDRFGQLDVLVNVAGILLLSHTHETTAAQWQKILDVNLTGTFLFCKAALPHLLGSGGNIVNTSSTSALAGMPYGAAYGASKGGVLALTRALAVEYGAQGVRVNAICPGSIKTPMGSGSNLPKDVNWELLKRAMPLDKPRDPEVVASVVALLASEDGAHINGESIRMDGGTLA